MEDDGQAVCQSQRAGAEDQQILLSPEVCTTESGQWRKPPPCIGACAGLGGRCQAAVPRENAMTTIGRCCG